MRYITKKVYYSMRFYGYFYSNLNLSYEDFLQEEAHAYKCSEKHNEDTEIAKLTYEKNFQNNFNDHVFHYEKVKSITFNKENKLKTLESNIYYQLKDLQRKYVAQEKSLFQIVMENATVLRNGDYSEGIRKLANLDKHDIEIISFVFQNTNLKVIFEIDQGICETYIFHTIENVNNMNITGTNNYHVAYEEIFMREDGTFEYNMLIRKWGNQICNEDIREVSIQFYDVEVGNRSLPE